MIRRWIRCGAVALAVAVAASFTGPAWLVPAAQARGIVSGAPGLPSTIATGDLPGAAARTLALIRAGGPFPYSKDGILFGNREHLLPAHPRGYYREYTVATRRGRGRGAKRIVCGGAPRSVDECYYSDDHYSSFKRIVG